MSSVFSWLVRRDRAMRCLAGEEARLHRSIYTAVEPFCSWNKTTDAQSQFGGVYNLEFSPDGSLLVAACEKKSIVLFDPITTRQTKAITSAHSDCVNCIKFLDERMFATCSDDATIALWDTRNLKTKLRSLHGHLNWVKNIEYSRNESLLVTSGFDGSVFTWDINSYTEQSLVYQKVFHMSGLMRCRISPDARKMVISTTGGYMIIVHNLDLSTLAKDMAGFKPNIYRVMQMNQYMNPYGATYEHIFAHTNKRNRVEFFSDFPEGNDAEVICSLQIHPQGWCALSRNISYDESTEWTTVHDIQDWDPRRSLNGDADGSEPEDDGDDENDDGSTNDDDDDDDEDTDAEESRQQSAKKAKLQASTTAAAARQQQSAARRINKRRKNAQARVSHPPPLGMVDEVMVSPEMLSGHPDIWAADVTIRQRNNAMPSLRMQPSLGPTHVYGIRSGVLTNADIARLDGAAAAASGQRRTTPEDRSQVVSRAVTSTSTGSTTRSSGSSSSSSSSSSSGSGAGTSTSQASQDQPAPPAILSWAGETRMRRMLNYIQEPNKGKGFIKELCFSADGRLICSPYNLGIRLLAFSPDCAELPKTLRPDGRPQPLSVLKFIKCHSDIVVCSKFSPRQPLLASGCLQGKVVWHQPVF